MHTTKTYLCSNGCAVALGFTTPSIASLARDGVI